MTPTPFPWIDCVIIIALVLLNGLFAMSELAIVSARTPRLQAMAERGNKGAAAAIELATDPGKFLSAVQIGITLIGIINGAYSGASLGGPVGDRLVMLGVPPRLGDELGFAVVIAITTFASLVVGELVPKQVALRIAEPVAALAAIPMKVIARITAPIVWLLDRTSALLLRLIGMGRSSEDRVTAEELHLIFAEAHRSGVIEESERAIMSGVVRLADRPVREVMTPRIDVDWIERDLPFEQWRARLAETPHMLVPVTTGSVDEIVGVVSSRDILLALLDNQPFDLDGFIRKPGIVPDQMDAMDVLRVLREADVPMAFVHDEYGHFEGLVTPADILAAIAGQFVSHQDADDDPMVVQREDGSLLVSGAMPADMLADRLGIELGEDRDYATAAGHVLAVMRRLPKAGEYFTEQGWRWEIVDMDGRKIDKLLLAREDAGTDVES